MPLTLKLTHSCFYEIVDHTKPATIIVYRDQGKKYFLFRFPFKPLIKITDYEKLLAEYERSTIFQELYKIASLLYLELYRTAVNWLAEMKISGFDFEEELKKYNSKMGCCPILKYLDPSNPNNNIYRLLRDLMIQAETLEAKSIICSAKELVYKRYELSEKDFKGENPNNRLRYKTDFFFEEEYTESGSLLFNAIANITYDRFGIFLKEQQSKGKKEEPIESFINNFDEVHPDDVLKHFTNGLVEKGYLTEKELDDYLKTAFELQTTPETIFKLKNIKTREKIYTVFYKYFKQSGAIQNTQTRYVELLSNYFIGFNTKTIKSNWSRGK